MWASLACSCWCPHVGQLKVFWLTFVAYAVLHSSRMSYSRIKPVLTSQEWFTWRSVSSMSQEEGLLDSLFLCFYSVGLFASGSLDDCVDRRHLLTACQLLSGLLNLLVSQWLEPVACVTSRSTLRSGR